MPKMAGHIKQLETISSVKENLDELKIFGEKIELSKIRMQTIKDKIEITRSQVESVEEVKEEEKKDEAVGAQSQYVAVEGDEIDQIVEKFMKDRDDSVQVVRISEGIYKIGDKQVSLKLEGESN